MSQPLANFMQLKWSRKLLVLAAYVALWIPLDYAASAFTLKNLPSSWYPNTGIALGFAAYFGWPLVFMEMICRALMAVPVWGNSLAPPNAFTFVLIPGLLTWLISSRLRHIIAFERRVDTAKMALIFVAFGFFGAVLRSLAIQLSSILTGIGTAGNFLSGFFLWTAGDLIGFMTLTPFVIAVLGPALAGKLSPQVDQRKIPFLAVAVLSLTLFFLLLTDYVPGNHFAYWHLAIGLHVFAAWSLGFRWTTFQIAAVNFFLTFVETAHPSRVLPLEQQGFLAFASGVGLYLAGQFAEKARHRESMERLSADLLNTAEDKNQFRNVLSHELRTPLAVILGYGELMKKNLFSSVQGLEKIKSNVQALSQILSRLMILTNPQGTWENSQLERVDLRKIVSAVAAKWAEAARKKNISLVWAEPEVPDLTATVIAEGVRIVLDEVVSNAVKFTDRGFVKITASADPRSRSMRVAVEDSGAGIDPSFPLFRTFEQESGGLTRPQGGLGIGLSICRMLLETMGGKITLQWSERGRGSLFVLEFYDQE